MQLVVLDGPYAGKVRSAEEVNTSGMEPQALLVDLARHGWRWEIIWPSREDSDAWLRERLRYFKERYGIDLVGKVTDRVSYTEAEFLAWAQADLVARVYFAATHGRAVRFQGRRWEPPQNQVDLEITLGEIEDAVVESGHYVGVIIDDWVNDLVIGVGARENSSGPDSPSSTGDDTTN